MLIFVVFLVSMNSQMVKTENDVVRVIIKEGSRDSCIVQQNTQIGAKFTLDIRSDFFIIESNWTRSKGQDRLEDLENSYVSVNYTLHHYATRNRYAMWDHTTKSKKYVMIKYKYLLTREVNGQEDSLEGNWKFSFKYLNDYNPWSLNTPNVSNCVCNTSVQLKTRSEPVNQRKTSGPPKSDRGGKSSERSMDGWVFCVVSLFGLLVVVQSSYIIYGKVKDCRAKRNNDEDPISPKSPKGKRSKRKRNIANRPPLPLPPDEVIQTPPQPPISPGPVHKHLFPTAPPMPVENPYSSPSDPGPLVPTQSYRSKALDASVEELRTPGFPRRHMDGPLVPKQSYRNKALDASVAELRTPGFPRRYMDGPLVPKQSYRNKALDASVEELRTPGFPRRYMDGPIVPKPTYRHSVVSDDSDEEHKAPGFARRQIEAQFAQLSPKAVAPSVSFKLPSPIVPTQTYRPSVESDDSDEERKAPGFARRQIEAQFAKLPPKGIAPSKSFKLPKPLPRSPPSPTLERVPPFNPAHRPEPGPPLHPKKAAVFPPPAPFRKQDASRMSDDEWQYEQLQPASKYLNNFSTTNNYNR